jgi:hypothetical protein
VNGTLEAASRRAVDDYLHAHPRAIAELELHRAMREQVRMEPPPIPAELGLDRTLARIAAERPAAPRPPASPRARWRQWLAGRGPTPALATLGAVVLIQGAIVALLLAERGDRYVETRGGVATANVAIIQVLFRPETPERELRAAIARAGGRIVDGPSDLGFFFVGIPPDRQEAALASLRAESSVADAQIAAGRRP